jgi:hypothetical protein
MKLKLKTAAALFAALLVGLFASCSQVSVQPETANPGPAPAGYGKVSVSVDNGARTLFPSLTFSKYVLSFAATGLTGPADEDLGTGTSHTATLPYGTWTITATAYLGVGAAEYVAAKGSIEVTINNATPTAKTIYISAPYSADGGIGTLAYSITSAAGPVLSAKLTGLAGPATGTDIPLTVTGTTESVTPGIYLLSVTADTRTNGDDTTGKLKGRNEVVYIYKDKTTTVPPITFSVIDFGDNLKLEGNLTVAYGAGTITSNTLYFYDSDGDLIQIAGATLDSLGAWENEFTPASLYYVDEIYFKLATEIGGETYYYDAGHIPTPLDDDLAVPLAPITLVQYTGTIGPNSVLIPHLFYSDDATYTRPTLTATVNGNEVLSYIYDNASAADNSWSAIGLAQSSNVSASFALTFMFLTNFSYERRLFTFDLGEETLPAAGGTVAALTIPETPAAAGGSETPATVTYQTGNAFLITPPYIGTLTLDTEKETTSSINPEMFLLTGAPPATGFSNFAGGGNSSYASNDNSSASPYDTATDARIVFSAVEAEHPYIVAIATRYNAAGSYKLHSKFVLTNLLKGTVDLTLDGAAPSQWRVSAYRVSDDVLIKASSNYYYSSNTTDWELKDFADQAANTAVYYVIEARKSFSDFFSKKITLSGTGASISSPNVTGIAFGTVNIPLVDLSGTATVTVGGVSPYSYSVSAYRTADDELLGMVETVYGSTWTISNIVGVDTDTPIYYVISATKVVYGDVFTSGHLTVTGDGASITDADISGIALGAVEVKEMVILRGTIDLSNFTLSSDAKLSALDGSGNELGSAVTFSSGNSWSIFFDPLDADTTVSFSLFFNPTIGAMPLTGTVTGVDTDNEQTGIVLTLPATPISTLDGDIPVEIAQNSFLIIPGTSGTLVLETDTQTVPSTLDTYLYLYGNGNLQKWNNNAGSGSNTGTANYNSTDSRIDWTVTAGDPYIVVVRRFPQTDDNFGTYKLHMTLN